MKKLKDKALLALKATVRSIATKEDDDWPPKTLFCLYQPKRPEKKKQTEKS